MTVLSVQQFGVAFGERVILDGITFELAARGVTVLVGPAGGGKSTLVRTLAGLNACHPSLSTWGRISSSAPPALVMQHARFYLDSVRENLVSALPDRAALDRGGQLRVIGDALRRVGLAELLDVLDANAVELSLALQRRLAIARALLSDPAVLMVDEPTAGLSDQEAEELVALLVAIGRARAVLLVTHHQRFAAAAGGSTMLLAGGRIVDAAPTESFFFAPPSELAQQFLRTGGCTPPLGVPETPRRSRFVGPRGFYWVLPDRLGGMPRPGIIDRLEHDLEGLVRLGVTHLVTLEETRTVAADALARRDIGTTHFPIVDMSVPTERAAFELCSRIAGGMKNGEVVALHCRAGLGRTGTLLACQLIFAGASARDAFELVRAINPQSIQSAAQVDFLRSFATDLPSLARAATLPSRERST